ncbi:MAG: hypothetical protein COZ46_01480 [Verrucomicrobia bacterium CG_4_10_14_3_um_filter_43_23]|nr:MAG: hypothetical protein AUJ82_01510 [Verrucomicrobia bacterium CG1_02_43_26]PIP59571.1 MAG: hypothetical protein COX01_03085 [Verrucomicrobia bacterium CG22_combo_CG10-13_8_21_14_all_43_17]PIX58870.1 MAG: hypothetical protein COZ46_01480 [Verrucomicrobia bacterium CG_4_10_14_3_um_filter_43_23]PIY61646.1 MAG: hypothetical protein COY94_04065 [Verrucomicrobia bacterium CG_4_10_14_0_8_um_filter_43_34]PJA44529.1 MAG: hypothetical protein CO175_02455 [Verrucomicrobia bacterium CG_4_9_14_3_um_fi
MSFSHKTLAQWYCQLGQTQDAGIPILDAIRGCDGLPQRNREVLANSLSFGNDWGKSLQLANIIIPYEDAIQIKIGAQTGKLSAIFHNLAEQHEFAHTARSKIISLSIYPAIVIHVAILAFPIMNQIHFDSTAFVFNFGRYAFDVLKLLAMLWGLFFAITLLARHQRSLFFKIVKFLPGLGAYIKKIALAKFASSLAAFIQAGVSLEMGWIYAGKASGDPKIEIASRDIAHAIALGHAPGNYLANYPCFPTAFTHLYRTGEQTGRLDELLLFSAKQLQQDANSNLSVVTTLYPTLIIMLLAFFVASKVIHIYGDYLKLFSNPG